MEAGTLVEWRVKQGDRVKRGDVVAVGGTDKGAIEIEVWESGLVEALLVEPGTKVPVGTALARIAGEGEAAGAAGGPWRLPPRRPGRRRPAPSPTRPAPHRPGHFRRAARRAGRRARASPAARARARELGWTSPPSRAPGRRAR